MKIGEFDIGWGWGSLIIILFLLAIYSIYLLRLGGQI